MSEHLEFWLPMSFIIVGVLLFLWEITQPGTFIAVPASVLVVLGIVGLVTQLPLLSGWSVLIAIGVAAPTTFATLKVYRKIAPPEEAPNTTTGQSLIGRTGRVTVEVVPELVTGKVRIDGQIWSARSEGEENIAVGTKVEVAASSGVHVIVRPVAAPAKAQA